MNKLANGSNVEIQPVKKGFIIYIVDGYTNNSLAVTRKELEDLAKLATAMLVDETLGV